MLQVLPLTSKGPLAEWADQLHTNIINYHRADYDTSGSIGEAVFGSRSRCYLPLLLV